MANRVTRGLARIADLIGRFWPMSKTQDQVLREYEAAHVRPQPTPRTSQRKR